MACLPSSKRLGGEKELKSDNVVVSSNSFFRDRNHLCCIVSCDFWVFVVSIEMIESMVSEKYAFGEFLCLRAA